MEKSIQRPVIAFFRAYNVVVHSLELLVTFITGFYTGQTHPPPTADALLVVLLLAVAVILVAGTYGSNQGGEIVEPLTIAILVTSA